MPTVQKINRPWVNKGQTQSEKTSDPFYHSPLWRKLTLVVRTEEPICYYCLMVNEKHLSALTDHERPRKIFPELSLTRTNLHGCCNYHHDQKRNWERTITTKEQFELKYPEFIDRLVKHSKNTR